MTVAPSADWMVLRHSGWYAGDDPWQSIYGPPLRLAMDARRFNVSPPRWCDPSGGECVPSQSATARRSCLPRRSEVRRRPNGQPSSAMIASACSSSVDAISEEAALVANDAAAPPTTSSGCSGSS